MKDSYKSDAGFEYHYETPDTMAGWEQTLGAARCIFGLSDWNRRTIATRFRNEAADVRENGEKDEKASHMRAFENLKNKDWKELVTPKFSRDGHSEAYRARQCAQVLADLVHKIITPEQAIARYAEINAA